MGEATIIMSVNRETFVPLYWSEWYKCENKVAVFAKALVQDPEKSKQLGGQTWTCTLVSVG